jgi:glycerophosphoryl diester phosphodiesterase
MGAGIVECDVTFTKDKELVCRHAQCDLHLTTNIVATPLGRKCREPFEPATYSADGTLVSPASAMCCTTDITLAEFKTLQGKMEASDSAATSPEQYMGGTPGWRTELYAGRGTLMTHRESIALFSRMNVQMIPELKAPEVTMPFEGFTQQDYARKLIREYEEAGITAKQVWPQSFNLNDVLLWVKETPAFGKQAVFLDDRPPSSDKPDMEALANQGVRIIAPPLWMLLEVSAGEIVPSAYARAASSAGLDIITWSLERSGSLADGGGYYYQSLNGPNKRTPQPGVIDNDGDMLTVLDVLAQEVGVIGIFSDWPGTVTYYANCMNL